MPTTKKSPFALLTVILAVSLAGCAIGNTAQSLQPTIGQELQDLKTALDKGAISQEEYDETKKRITQAK